MPANRRTGRLAWMTTSNEGDSPSNSSVPARDCTNRLTIGHLLLWTTTTGVVAAIIRVENISQGSVQSPTAQEAFRRWILTILAILLAPILGASLTAPVLTIHQWLTGRARFPSQPGHWLALALGIIATMTLLLLSVAEMASSPSPLAEALEQVGALGLVGAAVGLAILLARIASTSPYPLRWTMCLRIVA